MKLFGKKKTEDENISSVKELILEYSETEDDEEIAAVIMAAISACMSGSTYRLKIKSIKRVPNMIPVWNAAGRRENIDHQI